MTIARYAARSALAYLQTEAAMHWIFELPWPPSVNHYYRAHMQNVTKSGHVKFYPNVKLSQEGRSYRHQVAVAVLVQPHPREPLDGRLAVQIHAYPPDKRIRDLDNLLKSILDGLQHAGVYVADSQIDDLHIIRGGLARKHPRVRVGLDVISAPKDAEVLVLAVGAPAPAVADSPPLGHS